MAEWGPFIGVVAYVALMSMLLAMIMWGPRMSVRFKDVELFNVPPVSNEDAAAFVARLSGSEVFEWTGDLPPRSMMLFSVADAYPLPSTVQALLFPMRIDALVRVCTSAGEAIGYAVRDHAIGSLCIEYGGGVSGVSIKASESVPEEHL